MKVCTRNSDGTIIEAQSGNDKPGLKTLLQNALSAGYRKDEVTVAVVPDAEFHQMLAAQVEAERTYAERRKEAYPSVADQLDDLFKRGAFSPDMTARIAAIKDRFPKPPAVAPNGDA